MPFANNHPRPEFRPGREDAELNKLLGQTEPWDELTEVGQRITRRVIRLKGVVQFSAGPDYFNLWVQYERQWRRILPEVVRIIREETRDPGAWVMNLINPHDTTIPQWHLPLLHELFGAA